MGHEHIHVIDKYALYGFLAFVLFGFVCCDCHLYNKQKKYGS